MYLTAVNSKGEETFLHPISDTCFSLTGVYRSKHRLLPQIYNALSKMNYNLPSGNNKLIWEADLWYVFPRNFPFLTENVPGTQEPGVSFSSFILNASAGYWGLLTVLQPQKQNLYWGSVLCPAYGFSVLITAWNDGLILMNMA